MSRERIPTGAYSFVDAARIRERQPSRPDFGDGLYPASSDPTELRRVGQEHARAIDGIVSAMATKDDVQAIRDDLRDSMQDVNLRQAVERAENRKATAVIVAAITALGALANILPKFL